MLVERTDSDAEWTGVCGLAARRKFRAGRKKLPREARREGRMSRAQAVVKQSKILSLWQLLRMRGELLP